MQRELDEAKLQANDEVEKCQEVRERMVTAENEASKEAEERINTLQSEMDQMRTRESDLQKALDEAREQLKQFAQSTESDIRQVADVRYSCTLLSPTDRALDYTLHILQIQPQVQSLPRSHTAQ